MNIDKAKGISFTKRFEYLGDNALLKRILEISVECESLGTDMSMIHGVIEGLSNQAFAPKGILRENITINGTSFGNGYVQSIVANPEGPDQQRKTYTVNVVIEEAGELDKIINGIDSTLTLSIESISENYNISKDKKINNFSHEVEIKLNPDNKSQAFQNAKSIADAIYKDTTKLESLLQSIQFPTSFTQKKFKETDFDSASCTYRSNQNWVTYDDNTRNTDPDILASFQNRFEFVENGFANITLTVEAVGNSDRDVNTRFEIAKNFVTGQEQALKGVAETIFTAFIDTGKLGSEKQELQKTPISKTVVFSKNEAKASLTLVFTNNLEIDEQKKCIIEYSNTESLDGVVINVSEEGTVSGLLEVPNTYVESITDGTPKYDVAKAAFDQIKGEIKERCENFSIDAADSTFKITRKSETHAYNEGAIKYSYTYSNDKGLLYNDENDDSTIIRRESEQSSTEPYDGIKIFAVYTPLGEDKFQILQDQKNNKVFEREVKTTTRSVLSTKKLNEIFGVLNLDNIQSNPTSFLENLNIKYSSSNRQVVTTQTILNIK
jgi:hypothetical protein